MRTKTCITKLQTLPLRRHVKPHPQTPILQRERERERERELFAVNIVKKAARLFENLQTFGKKVICVLGIKVIAKKRHHEPAYIKANISTAQKISKYFAIKKGGEAKPINLWAICKRQFATHNIQNKKERGTYKYYYPIAFKLQHW